MEQVPNQNGLLGLQITAGSECNKEYNFLFLITFEHPFKHPFNVFKLTKHTKTCAGKLLSKVFPTFCQLGEWLES